MNDHPRRATQCDHRQITQIERAATNIGRSETLGNYATETLRCPGAEDSNKGIGQRSSFIEKHPRGQHVWHWSPKLSKPWGTGNEETFNQNEMIDIASSGRRERFRCRNGSRCHLKRQAPSPASG
jgi:hypothetical protein